jgi:hypothetical protein
MNRKLDKRIAIIGAGPGGLGAAEALREKGYKNITIFERSNRVGGQALTCDYVTKDGRALKYDLGSIQPMSSKILRRLIKQNGLSYGRGPFEKKTKLGIAYKEKTKIEVANFRRRPYGFPLRQLPLVIHDFIKLFYHLWRYRRLSKPGFYNFKHMEETTIDFKEWIYSRNFKLLDDVFFLQLISTLSLTNKNNERKIQLYIVLKFLYQVFKIPARYYNGSYRPIREGYQELWNRVAKNFDVRLKTNITSITRNENKVTIKASEETFTFDDVIISCAFDKVEKVIDTNPDELKNFSKIYYNPGYRGAFVAKNGPKEGIYWFMDSYYNEDEKSYLSLLFPEGEIDENTTLYSACFSHCPDKAKAVEIIQESTNKFMREEFNAEIVEWPMMHYWSDYDAVFDIDLVKDGVFDRIQDMQGKSNTYYVGQLISSPSHSGVVDYCYELVGTHF